MILFNEHASNSAHVDRNLSLWSYNGKSIRFTTQQQRHFPKRLKRNATCEGNEFERSSKLFHESSEIRNKRQVRVRAILCPNLKWRSCFYYEQFLSQLTLVPTSSFLLFHVPTNATSTATGLTSLNDVTIAHVSATSATTTATMTQVPVTDQIDKCKATRSQHKTRSPSILHPAKIPANYATQKNSCCLLIRTTQQLRYQVFCCLATPQAQQLRQQRMPPSHSSWLSSHYPREPII
jgi:hypothetical protein